MQPAMMRSACMHGICMPVLFQLALVIDALMPITTCPSRPGLQLVKAARNDPLVQELYDPTFVGTIFAPLDEVGGERRARACGPSSTRCLLPFF